MGILDPLRDSLGCWRLRRSVAQAPDAAAARAVVAAARAGARDRYLESVGAAGDQLDASWRRAMDAGQLRTFAAKGVPLPSDPCAWALWIKASGNVLDARDAGLPRPPKGSVECNETWIAAICSIATTRTIMDLLHTVKFPPPSNPDVILHVWCVAVEGRILYRKQIPIRHWDLLPLMGPRKFPVPKASSSIKHLWETAVSHGPGAIDALAKTAIPRPTTAKHVVSLWCRAASTSDSTSLSALNSARVPVPAWSPDADEVWASAVQGPVQSIADKMRVLRSMGFPHYQNCTRLWMVAVVAVEKVEELTRLRIKYPDPNDSAQVDPVWSAAAAHNHRVVKTLKDIRFPEPSVEVAEAIWTSAAQPQTVHTALWSLKWMGFPGKSQTRAEAAWGAALAADASDSDLLECFQILKEMGIRPEPPPQNVQNVAADRAWAAAKTPQRIRALKENGVDMPSQAVVDKIWAAAASMPELYALHEVGFPPPSAA